MFPTDVVILAGARTPMARYNGEFAGISAIDLGAIAAKEAVKRSGVDAGEVDHVVFGNVQQSSADAHYGARHVGLKAGLKVETPAVTVNRLCGSGMEAISQAAQRILLGEAKTILAGGMENMTQVPHVIRGARSGFRLGEGKLEDALMAGLLDPISGCTMSDTAENLAAEYKITRKESDEFALRSQQAAEAAYRACRMEEELVPVEVGKGKKAHLFSEDDHRRPDTTMESLSALPPAFRKDGVVTAGNASGIVDGAAAVVATHAKTAKERGWKPLGKIVSWATVGVEPRIMGIGPVPATRKALELAGLKLEQMDLIEVNEAFAPQYLAVEKTLGLNRDKVNVNGGAIALGHPLGATGARLILTLLLELRRRNARYGLATACIGGGQGIAMIVESLP
ncbi:MAG TPA: acetyl-CoA C-acetyltransferase [Candidatus Acidoferrales bacterium]|nr:acetyl-CoA C-acetyltransferase [Candidatus Acidoferrales bacterium]HEV2340485.1 acetyl-CoA C-acetyltransferase [Candidatus Acidoferrales bacterium]